MITPMISAFLYTYMCVSVYFDKRYAYCTRRHTSRFIIFQELERTLFRISFEYAAALTTDYSSRLISDVV